LHGEKEPEKDFEVAERESAKIVGREDNDTI